jgi:hypothetical protein
MEDGDADDVDRRVSEPKEDRPHHLVSDITIVLGARPADQ